MPWPLEAEGVRHFAEGLEEILVVEEKRQIIEYQLKEMLYTGARTCGRASSASSTTAASGCPRTGGRRRRPRRAGSGGGVNARRGGVAQRHGRRRRRARHWLLPPTGELTPAIVARAIAARIAHFHSSPAIRERLAFLDAKEAALARPRATVLRTP